LEPFQPCKAFAYFSPSNFQRVSPILLSGILWAQWPLVAPTRDTIYGAPNSDDILNLENNFKPSFLFIANLKVSASLHAAQGYGPSIASMLGQKAPIKSSHRFLKDAPWPIWPPFWLTPHP
jgi:hypothetical protein